MSGGSVRLILGTDAADEEGHEGVQEEGVLDGFMNPALGSLMRNILTQLRGRSGCAICLTASSDSKV